jgi:hypothetical protein
MKQRIEAMWTGLGPCLQRMMRDTPTIHFQRLARISYAEQATLPSGHPDAESNRRSQPVAVLHTTYALP